MTGPLVSVVIVSHDSAADLDALLPTLDDPRLQVIVVDSASTDGSAERSVRPHVTVEALPDNVGWARGGNLGATRATAPVLAFVNPDARPTPDQLIALASRLDGKTGTVSPRFVDGAGRTAPFYFRFTGPVAGLFCFLQGGQRIDALLGHPFIRHREYGSGAQLPRDVDHAGAACLLTRADTFRTRGRFDDDLFLFFADTSFTRRVRDSGLRNDVAWDVPVPHSGGASVRRNPVPWIHLHVQRDYLRYVQRWYGPKVHALTVAAVMLLTGLLPAALRLLRGRPREARAQLAYARAICTAPAPGAVSKPARSHAPGAVP